MRFGCTFVLFFIQNLIELWGFELLYNLILFTFSASDLVCVFCSDSEGR